MTNEEKARDIVEKCEAEINVRAMLGATENSSPRQIFETTFAAEFRKYEERIEGLEGQLSKINTPEIANFLGAVENEAKHQRVRWGSQHDAGKTDADWFWLIGYLAGKAIGKNVSVEKQVHHIVTTAAACLNWHAAKTGVHNEMRPGIQPPEALAKDDEAAR